MVSFRSAFVDHALVVAAGLGGSYIVTGITRIAVKAWNSLASESKQISKEFEGKIIKISDFFGFVIMGMAAYQQFTFERKIISLYLVTLKRDLSNAEKDIDTLFKLIDARKQDVFNTSLT